MIHLCSQISSILIRKCNDYAEWFFYRKIKYNLLEKLSAMRNYRRKMLLYFFIHNLPHEMKKKKNIRRAKKLKGLFTAQLHSIIWLEKIIAYSIFSQLINSIETFNNFIKSTFQNYSITKAVWYRIQAIKPNCFHNVRTHNYILLVYLRYFTTAKQITSKT